MKKIFFSITILLLVMDLFSGCRKDPSPQPEPGPNTVWIQHMAYNPDSLTVKVNTPIAWINKDGVAHNVTSDAGWFSSGNIAPGDTFSNPCTTPGHFTYSCTLHPNEHGSVTVR